MTNDDLLIPMIEKINALERRLAEMESRERAVGNMLKSVYDANNNGIVDAAESVPWSGVTGKPFESGTYTPAPVGLTDPVISVAAGEYRIIGDVCKVWGRLDITSWSGSSGGMFITLPINPAVDQRVIGVVNYYRNGGSTEEGAKAAYSRNNVLAIYNSAGSNYISWESSALVQLRFMVEYPISA